MTRHLRSVTNDAPGKGYDTDFAEMILHASRVIRYRAAQAMPGPYTAWPATGSSAEVVTSATTGLTVGIAPPPIEDVGWSVAPGTAEHFAGWPPELAMLVADWLDSLHHRVTVDRSGYSPAEETHARLIARATHGGLGRSDG